MLTLPRRRRSWTLIGALITVAVPGTLMAVAAAGHISAQSAAADVASAANSLATPARTSPSAVATPASGPGIRLLTQAASAGQSTSYQGVEMISRWTMAGTSTVLSTVWHSSGGRTMTQTADAASSSATKTQISYDPYQELPEGVFGVTKPLIALLGTHYQAIAAGTASVAGRSARVVEIRRPNGALAARFWLDSQTSLPLRREDYGGRAQVITEATFIQVKFGVAPAPAPTASIASIASGSTWSGVAVPAALVNKLRTKGWPLPAVLPSGLSLYAAAVSSTPNEGVVDLSYSDGLFEVSLFVQRGELAQKLTGWQVAKISGREVFVSPRGATWSAGGYVYTVLADAPPQVVTEAVAALPHDTPPGFWLRLGRGLKRLGHMVDPFR